MAPPAEGRPTGGLSFKQPRLYDIVARITVAPLTDRWMPKQVAVASSCLRYSFLFFLSFGSMLCSDHHTSYLDLDLF